MEKRPNRIYEQAIENAMSYYGHNNACIGLTGTHVGLSYEDWEQLIIENLREPLFGTARCLRKRAWNAEDRLKQLEELNAKKKFENC